MVKITKRLASQSVISKRTYGTGNTKEFIVIHETANTGKGAGASSHARLQSNLNPRSASWHYQVDDTGVIQSFEDNIRCWHAGTEGNNKGIAIEIAVNSDSDFKKAVAHAVELVKALRQKYGIPVSKVKQHKYFTGKNCPTNLINGAKGITWNDFVKSIGGKGSTITSSKPSKPTASANTATSVVDYLVANKQDSSFSNRRKLAEQHGIKGYTGTASQNSKLLGLLKTGKKTTTPKPKPTVPKKNTSTYTGKSVVDYLVHTNQNSSYGNRAKLASQYGIKGYTGTASQNSELLKKLQAGTKAPTSTSSYKGKSLVDYLVHKKQSHSFANRKKLAGQHGIKGYTGTASQNSELLNKLQGKKPAPSRPAPKTIKVGSTVQVRKGASKFATGQSIASEVKGKKYKVIQIRNRGKGQELLLDKVLSWVYTKDVN